MPSLSSPDAGSLPEDDLAFMTLNMEDEMDLRAPYISMSETDDLPLLISDDLMWGAHPETVTLATKDIKMAAAVKHQQQCCQESSLAALLAPQEPSPPSHDKKMIKVIEPSQQHHHHLVAQSNNEQIVNPLDVMGFSKSEWNRD